MKRAKASFSSYRGWGRAVRVALVAAMLATPVFAQDVFFTQSGGRGLQNAKMNARVSKVEGDLKDTQAELAKVQPFAKVAISACTDAGDKLRWTGGDWYCDSETDPTVQAFAKKALPTCGGGQILSASGSEFNCVNSGFLSAETDPTVQGFAKAPLPNCGTGEVLTSSGSGLGCATDERGLTKETDPLVHAFARTDAATVQNCEAGKVLSMIGSRLQCVFDAVGITVEVDPTMQEFAKNAANGGYTLGACGAGEVLKAVDVGGKVQLACEDGATAVGPAIAAIRLDDLADVNAAGATSDEVLRFDGSKWVASNDKIGSGTNNKWCYFTASEIVCDRDTPAPMPAAACAASEVITWDDSGKVWGCTSIAGTISETLALKDLSDVDVVSPVAGQGLTYDGSGWVNGYDMRIANYDTDVRVLDTSGGNGVAQVVVDGTALLTAENGKVGIRTNNPNADLDVFGTISATNMRYTGWMSGAVVQASGYVSAGTINTSGSAMVSGTTYTDALRVNGDAYVQGNFYVSGSQSFDGVTFANGGVSATGTISATRFVGDGSGLTGVAGGDIIISGTTFAQATEDDSITFVTNGGHRMVIGGNGKVGVNTAKPSVELEVDGTVSATNLHLSGNLYVSGTQTIDGVVFANGGVSATGTISATGFHGDGSGLSNVTASSMDWYGLTRVPVQVVAVSEGTAIQMAGISATNVSATGNVSANGIAAATGGFTSVVAAIGSFGNVNATGYVSAATINTSGTARVSNTLYADVLRSVGNSYVGQDLYVKGGLYVSGSQNIDGVVFANGGVSATGTVSATRFFGDGGGLTGLASGDRIVSGTSNVLVSEDGSVTITTAGGQKLIVGANGNVGIGTMLPAQELEVVGAGRFSGGVDVAGANVIASNRSLVNLGGMVRAGVGAGLSFQTNGANTEHLVITTAGNVGVGTSSPAASMDVSGTMKVAGGTGAEGCSAGVAGLLRRNPVSGRMQVCQ